MPGISKFFVNVPQLPVSLTLLSVYIDLDTDSVVKFRVTSPPSNGKNTQPLQTGGPYGPSTAANNGNPTNSPTELHFGATNIGSELSVVLPNTTVPVSDPLRRRYQLVLSLLADYDHTTCANTNLPGITNEQWTIELLDNANVPKQEIVGAGVASLRQPVCNGNLQPVLTPGQAATVGIALNCTLTNASTVAALVLPGTAANLSVGMHVASSDGTGIAAGTTIQSINIAVSPNQITLSAAATAGGAHELQFAEVVAGVVGTVSVLGFPRLGVDAVLVLDRSGSMLSPAINGQATPTRIKELQDSLSEFAIVWDALRTAEGALQPQDNIGVTIFDDLIEWWSVLPVGLNTFNSARSSTIQSNASTITPRNLTSIGGGLVQADGVLTSADPSRRRVILLMSDGLQNFDPKVGVQGNQVVTTTGVNPPVPLPHQANYQIYTVTVGPSNLVDARINQELAQATQGFYTNSEDNATLLAQFFLELLQNFVHFTSWETFRLIRAALTAQSPTFTATVPVSTTTTNVSVALRTAEPRLFLRLRVTPPGETTPTDAFTSDGIAVLNFAVPTSPNYDFLGTWTIVVDVPVSDQPGVTGTFTHSSAAGSPGAVFDLAVIGDDIGLHSDLSIVPSDYVPGQPIQFAATLLEFGKRVRGLGSQPGDRLLVEVVKPGAGVGDLLSDSTAPATSPFPSDPSSPAQAKLLNHLQADPNSLTRISGDVVTLVDDGAGVYRGSYAVQTPGHYNFLFGIQGRTTGVGAFSREQLKTVYVRAKPDGTATNIQTSTQAVSGGNQLTISFTPRSSFGPATAPNPRLGPGWRKYFWLTTPGQTPFNAIDNMDGTYTAKLLYGGLVPPPVTLHFIDAAVLIDDTTPPDRLPVPLGPDTVLVPFVNPGGFLSRLPLVFWLLLLIAFLVGLVIGLLI